jgi:hypothetical protein
MRKGIGCILMLVASGLSFVVIGALVEYAALSPGRSLDLRPAWLALAGALILYGVGVVLLTSITPVDRPRRRFPWQRTDQQE